MPNFGALVGPLAKYGVMALLAYSLWFITGAVNSKLEAIDQHITSHEQAASVSRLELTRTANLLERLVRISTQNCTNTAKTEYARSQCYQ